MASRLAATVLGVAFVSLLVATLVSVNAGQRLGTSIYEERLEAVRSSGSIDVAFRLNSLAAMSRALGASPQAAAAIELFSAELNIIDAEETVSRSDAEDDRRLARTKGSRATRSNQESWSSSRSESGAGMMMIGMRSARCR